MDDADIETSKPPFFLEENQKKFKAAFLDILDRTYPDWLLDNKERAIRILSIGCGMAFEAKPLLEQFLHAKFHGVDIDAGRIDDARTYAELQGVKGTHFRTVNAKTEEAYRINGASEIFDLIVIRSPDFYKAEWKDVIKTATKHLAEDGLFYITTEDSTWKNNISTELKNQSLNTQTLKNPFSQREFHHENYVIIAQKQPNDTLQSTTTP